MRSVEANEPTPSVVTPGNYDGVHLGHRALVSAARQVASESSTLLSAGAPEGTARLRVVALTFDPHPLHFIAPDRGPQLLTSVPRRIELLRAAGADEVVVQTFDRELSRLSPTEFVERILVEQLNARAIVVGADFGFGAQRAGDVALLESLGTPRGISVTVVPPVTLAGEIVSSTHVRAALLRGDVELAARMLARVHDIERRVLLGFQRGRTIGFPTANLELAGSLAPADGVYAVSVRVLDGDPAVSAQRYLGVANLGLRPTVQGGRSMEVHLLDFAGDLYDHRLRVGFVARLRGEAKFANLDALRAQIARDVEAGRRALESCDAQLLSWI